MWGGQATLHFDPRESLRLFATLSRGYKAGGFNLGQAALLRARFEPEYLWSIDVGAKGEWLDRRLYADVTAFYMKRSDMQVVDRRAARSGRRSEQLLLLHGQRVGRPQSRPREQRALARDRAARSRRRARPAAHPLLRAIARPATT